MNQSFFFGSIYGLFLFWHRRWFSKPLTEAEVNDHFAQFKENPTAAPLDSEGEANARAFFLSDDGRPFYMINLMRYREKAVYPESFQLKVETGEEANALYTKAVIQELLKRGCYPVFHGRKLANMMSAGAGTDFFEEVAIVRYRSRRDLMDMAASPAFQAAEPHKWASMERTVVVPARKIILLDPAVVLPLLLLLFSLLSGRRSKRRE